MQNAPEINWLLVAIQTLVPSFVALGVGIWVSRMTENYKKEISKELESYKHQLQSDFQTKFYEFQTRYSILYRERAEAVKTLYSLLAKTNSEITQFFFDSGGDYGLIDRNNVINKFEELIDFNQANQIFFSEEIKNHLNSIMHAFSKVIFVSDDFRENHEFMRAIKEKRKYEPNEFKERFKISEIVGDKPFEIALEKINTEIPELMKLLERV